jgi:uncharacterized protein YndB with AHSA1/START domain
MKVHVTHQVGASPQRAFDAWLDPETAGRWLFATEQVICVEIDARVGGWFYIVERCNGENVEYVGEYLEMVRPHRLTFIIAANKYALDFDRVTVMFRPHGSDCELRLAHETSPELAQQMRRRWTRILDGLAATLGDGCHDTQRRELAAPLRQ